MAVKAGSLDFAQSVLLSRPNSCARKSRRRLGLGGETLQQKDLGVKGETNALPQTVTALAASQQTLRPRAFDASEGTVLDPLRDKSWDLTSAKTVPTGANLH